MCGFYSLVGSILEKWPFFRADTAGLGKYCTGGYGRIGVYRVKLTFTFEVNEKYEKNEEMVPKSITQIFCHVEYNAVIHFIVI